MGEVNQDPELPTQEQEWRQLLIGTAMASLMILGRVFAKRHLQSMTGILLDSLMDVGVLTMCGIVYWWFRSYSRRNPRK